MEQKDIEKLEAIKKQRDEYLAGWQRAKADFANYKKEDTERKKMWASFATQAVVEKLLSVLDSLERAEKEAAEREDEITKGFLSIATQLREFFTKEGVQEIEALGKDFDPAVHESVASVEGKEPGKVAEVVEKGYMFEGRLIRPAKVKIVQ